MLIVCIPLCKRCKLQLFHVDILLCRVKSPVVYGLSLYLSAFWLYVRAHAGGPLRLVLGVWFQLEVLEPTLVALGTKVSQERHLVDEVPPGMKNRPAD